MVYFILCLFVCLFFSFAILHTLKTDSSKSLSLCNLIMEETPDSGLAEEIQRSQIDLGAFIWGPDASTESVSQEITQGGSQEDSSCLSEAEQDMRLSTGMLPSADWHTVADQGELVVGPAPPGGSEQLYPKPMPEAEFATAAYMEMERPHDLSDSEMAATETGGPVEESPEDVEQSEEEEEKQKIEDSLWAGVETYEKVDTGPIDLKALEGTEEFEEKARESAGNRLVDLLETTGKPDQETLEISKEEVSIDLRASCRESEKASAKNSDTTDVLEKDLERVATAAEFGYRNQGLDEGRPVVINNCEIIEGSGANPAHHADVLNLRLQTNSVSNIENASPEGWDLARRDIRKNSIGPPNHGVIHHSGRGSADAEEIQQEAVLPTPGVGRDEHQAVVSSVNHEVAAQSRTDLNYSLGANANRRDWCLCKAEFSLIEGSESTVTGNCSPIINLPSIVKTDSWATDPGQIWQPRLDSAVNNVDVLEFSGIPDGQASGFANWFDSINHWPIRDVGGLDNSWEHLDTIEGKRGLEVDSPADVVGGHAIAKCWEQRRDTARPLVLGTSHNASTDSPASPQDSDISNSDLSEDEIANQRYGLLYQEIEPDKEEVLTLVCSID